MADAPFNLGAILNSLGGEHTMDVYPEEDKEVKELKEQERKVLLQMGVDPSQRRDQNIQKEWSSKGKMGKFGMFLSEALRGAAQGRSTVPYSDRKYQEALRDDAAQRPFLKEQLEGIIKQRTERERNVTSERNALTRLQGVEGRNKALSGITTEKGRQFDALFPGMKEESDAKTNKLNSEATYKDLLGENVAVKTVNDSHLRGLGGNAGLEVLRANDPKLNASVTANRKTDAHNKPQRSFQSQNGNPALVDAVMKNPLIWETLTGRTKDALSAPLAQRGFDQFGKPLSDGAVTRISDSKTSIAGLGDLKDAIVENYQYIGPIEGMQSWNPYSPARLAQQKLDLIRQRVGKALESGVLRKEDEQKYKKILATMFDTPENAMAKVDYLIENIGTDMKIFQEEQKKAGRRVNMDPAKPGVPVKESAPAVGDITLDAVKAEVERRRKMKGTK
jgi:hypothetical protein